METFPARVFIQVFTEKEFGGKMIIPPEGKLVAEEMKSRGIPVVFKTSEEIFRKEFPLTLDDLVVGDFDWIRKSMKQLGIPMPIAPDYPQCLEHLLNRKIWFTTLGEVEEYLKTTTKDIFIKPAVDVKAFSGLIEPKEQMLQYVLEQFPRSFPVVCSELAEFVSEYRVYVVNGEIKGVGHYRGPKEKELDMKIVEDAVKILSQSDEGKELKGCSLDFAVMRISTEKPQETKEPNSSEDKQMKPEEQKTEIKNPEEIEANNKIAEEKPQDSKESGSTEDNKAVPDDATYLTTLIEVNDGFALGWYEGVSAKDYTDLLIERWKELLKNHKRSEKTT